MKYLFLVLFLYSFCTSSTFAQLTSFEQTANFQKNESDKEHQKEIGELTPLRSCFDVTFYDIEIEPSVSRKRVRGKVKINFELLEESQFIQLELYKDLEIDNILFLNQKNSKSLKYDRNNCFFVVDFGKKLSKGSYSISIDYHGKVHVAEDYYSKGIFFEKTKGRKSWIGVTCEATGAHIWFPCKDHPSDEADSVRISVITPSDLRAIANGNLERFEILNEKKVIYHWLTNYPTNTYGISFYIGNYKPISEKFDYEKDGKTEEINFLFYPLEEDYKDVESQKDFTIAAFTFFDSLLGDYPFDKEKIGIVQSPYNGMEHQTCVGIGKNWKKEDDYMWKVAKQDWNGTIIHELAHEWFGNAVTAADMSDVWLHEGFATYMELLFVERVLGKEQYNKLYLRFRHNTMYNHESILVGKRNEHTNMITSGFIYYRGAVVLHKIREKLDDDALFFQVLREFYQQNKYKTVLTEDFIELVNKTTKTDYTKFLKGLIYDGK
ncbi:M1 family metallopeptidase [Bernardetia sp. OM2101]|uniref:M1 family metallopeptidase n=1 Tax=Bernardetia sp. OM2101 TaxID=3344876 RepID=UPI0035D01C9D